MRNLEERSPQEALRRRHEQRILHLIRPHTPVSRSQLTELTGLSAQAIGSIVRNLIAEGLVEETPMPRQEGPGAPPVGLRLRAEGALALGFGLERDSLRGVLLDLAGNVRWQMSEPIAIGESAVSVLGRIGSAVEGLFADAAWQARRAQVVGLGMAVPGPIDLREGVMVDPPNFAHWNGVRVAEALSGRLGLPVIMDNASTAAAAGLAWLTARSRQPFLYCYWGIGIGGGLVLGYDAYRGTTGNAVEIGHVVVDPYGHTCQCGGVGCLEAEASAAAILRDAAVFGSFATVEEVVRAAAQSKELRDLLGRAAERLAAGLVTVVNITDVDEVVLGGAHFAAVAPIFFPVVKDRVEARAFRRGVARVHVRMASLGEEANAIGAAAIVFHTLLPRRSGMLRASSPRERAVLATAEAALSLPEVML